VNLNNGNLTPFVQHLQTTKGLVYLNADGTQTQLALNGSSSSPITTKSSSGGSSNTGLIVGIIIAALVILGGGYWFVSRGRTAS
jgi:hypothetical protein